MSSDVEMFGKRLILLLFLLICRPSFLAAEGLEAGETHIYGGDYAFAVQIPKGWFVDNSRELPFGIAADLCLEGTSCEKSPSRIQFSIVPRGIPVSLEEIMSIDVIETLKKNPDLALQYAGPVKSLKGSIIPIFYYLSKSGGKTHAVAPMDVDGRILGISLMSASKKSFNNSVADFRTFVASIRRIKFRRKTNLCRRRPREASNVCC